MLEAGADRRSASECISAVNSLRHDFDAHPAVARRGTDNPETIENPLWRRAAQSGWSAAKLAHEAGPVTLGPVWSLERFGGSQITLPDGRVVHIAGRHRDSRGAGEYFYNDVVVEHPDGAIDFHLYPTEVFPPVAYHSATLMGGEIWLIGGMGVGGAPSETIQVVRLDTSSFRIERVATAGEAPGPLSRHRAERLDETRILIMAGHCGAGDSMEPNREIFELDVTTLRWRRRAHGDAALFPVPKDVYETCKSPRSGRANPEKSDNPFWLEMARRRWLPSRARLHYGDFGPKDPRRPPTPAEVEALPPGATFGREAVDCPKVWTARRADAAIVTLDDGSRLRIGGVVHDFKEGFREEWADVWTYADVMLEKPGGEIDIFIYPPDVFPPLWPLCALARPGCVLIFGDVDNSPGREDSRPVVLRLDTQTFEIRLIDEGGAPPRVTFARDACRVEGDRALFELWRKTEEEPRRWAAFDMAALSWRPEILPGDEAAAGN